MNRPRHSQSSSGARRNRAHRGFSAIELIGVLAILTILALALLPSMIQTYDRTAREAESKSLSAIAEGLRQHILRQHRIPDHTTFAQDVATQLGWELGDVTTNPRREPRIFLIDPALTNTFPLPFTQSQFGITNDIPSSVRVMILSSVGRSLPSGLVSGYAASTNAFAEIWNTADERIPASWSWPGRGADLRIERVGLDTLFVPVMLNYDTFSSGVLNTGRFTVDGSATNTLPSSPTYRTMLLKGSVLGLHSHTGTANTLQAREVIGHAASYVYERDAWRGALFLGRGFRPTSGFDIQAASDLFVSAATNANAQGNPAVTQPVVVAAASNYMRAFLTWQADGYPNSGASFSAVDSAQRDMDTISQNLIHKP